MISAFITAFLVSNVFLFRHKEHFSLYWSAILRYEAGAAVICLLLAIYQQPLPDNFITTNSGKEYTFDKLKINSQPYTDRSYRFTRVPPELSGATLIQTSNNDKGSNLENLFAIHVGGRRNSLLHIIVDSRAIAHGVPRWLRKKKRVDLGRKLVSTDKDGQYIDFIDTLSGTSSLYFPGNRDNQHQGNTGSNAAFSMYFVALSNVDKNQIRNQNDAEWLITAFTSAVGGGDSAILRPMLHKHQFWLKSDTARKGRFDLSSSSAVHDFQCFNCDLSKADLSGIGALDSSCFSNCLFKETEFSATRFRNVNFFNSHLDSANFFRAAITDCSFLGSDLKGANFKYAKFKNVDLTDVNLAGVNFEPDSLPNLQGIASSRNLDSITFVSNPGALVKLKQKLKAEGFNEAHRRVTAAIQRRKHELSSSFLIRTTYYILFDMTCLYGLNPMRPILILLIMIYIFYKVYLLLFFYGKLNIRIAYSLQENGAIKPVTNEVKPGSLLFLSIVTAFSIGFGPYTINDWVKKLLKEDYTFTAYGYTRVLIGIQNLVSLYLFSLTMLLLFGDPFNF